MAAHGAWGRRADVLHDALDALFWERRRRLYRMRSGRRLRRLGTWNYWWQAHALAAAADRYLRRPEPALAARVDDLVVGILTRNRSAHNEFYDDMGWLALGLLHVAEHVPTRLPVLVVVDGLLADLRGGWSPLCGGGVAWARPHPDFKNVPASGPAAIVAAHRAAATGDVELLGWASGLADWLHATLVEPAGADAGAVWDGTHARADGGCELERREYTYCYGLVVGVDVALAGVVGLGDVPYVGRARRTAAVALARMTDPATGVWRAEGGGDGGLFKGVLARYVGDLAVRTGDAALAGVLAHQGEAVWRCAARGGLVGGDWARPAPYDVDLSEQLSGVLLLEQCARVEAAGLLDPRTDPR